MTILVCWVAAVFYVEAVTEILLTGSIFDAQRHWILMRPSQPFRWFQCGPYKFLICKLAELAVCGHCLSVWTAAMVFWALPLQLTDVVVVDYAIKLFFLQRLSNVLHELLSRWFNRVPWNLVVTNIQSIEREQGGTQNDGPTGSEKENH